MQGLHPATYELCFYSFWSFYFVPTFKKPVECSLNANKGAASIPPLLL